MHWEVTLGVYQLHASLTLHNTLGVTVTWKAEDGQQLRSESQLRTVSMWACSVQTSVEWTSQVVAHTTMASRSYLVKLTMVGDMAVGKSAILHQFAEGSFKKVYDLTIGVEFAAKVIYLGETTMKLQVWDTAGQESFRAITRSYYRGSAAILIVYSVTSRESFDHVRTWVSEANSGDTASLVLVGNKIDGERQVATEEGQQLANELGMPFVEVTATNKEQTDMLFTLVSRVILGRIDSGQVAVGDTSGVRDFHPS